MFCMRVKMANTTKLTFFSVPLLKYFGSINHPVLIFLFFLGEGGYSERVNTFEKASSSLVLGIYARIVQNQ